MDAIVYKITCLTNLHVGDGEANFNIIDNTVQKDPVLCLPTINSSGVKGALRQHFKEKNVEKAIIKEIFGSEQGEKSDKNDNICPGQVKFYQADLLARPVRAAKGDMAYYMATSYDALELYNIKANIFGAEKIDISNLPDGNITNAKDIAIEDNIEPKCVDYKFSEILTNLISTNLVILNNSVLKDISLPVLARNHLDNGVSKNLWYEEVVPHKSIFTFAVSSDNSNALKNFKDILDEERYVQFGGNASIGYGLCLIEKIGGTI